MSSGPTPSITYTNSVELRPNDASASSFTVGNISKNNSDPTLASTTFTLTDGGNNDGVLGDSSNEGVNVTTDPSGYYLSPRNFTYWGEAADGSGVVVRYPSSKTADGYVYTLFTNSTSYNALDEVPRSNFSQTPFTLCFGSGTRILTARGEVSVEALQIGDRAVTASGRHRTITWVGQRQLGSHAQPLAPDQAPVRVRAGAFGHGLPERDLLLSPGHPVLVGADADNEGGVLVPVMCLINGTTISRTQIDSVTYWHVELDAHDILLAEGLPAESYIDLGTRAWFAGADSLLLDPDLAMPGMKGRCRPVAVDGPLVEAERARLDTVLVEALAEDCAWADCAWAEADILVPAAA